MLWFSDQDLRRLAGAKSYERGVGYVDQVGDLDELPDGVIGSVQGTEPYQVRLRNHGGGLDGNCTCPYGQDGAFCKHCVAVGLVLLTDAPKATPRRSKPTSVDLRSYLSSVDPAELVDLLLDLAADDPALHRRLALRAATHGAPDITELRRLVGGLRTRGFIDYSRSFAYAQKANDVLDALDTVARTHPAAAGPLYRSAIRTSSRRPNRATTPAASSATRSTAPSTATPPPATPLPRIRRNSPPGSSTPRSTDPAGRRSPSRTSPTRSIRPALPPTGSAWTS